MADKLDLDALARLASGSYVSGYNAVEAKDVLRLIGHIRELERAIQPGGGEAEDERAAFHSFVNGAGGHTMRRADGSYVSSMTELWWKCWKARASLDGRREGNE